MNAKDVAEKAIEKMNRKLTDEIFLLIQNDHELMHEYLLAVQEQGLKAVNTQIGKLVKKVYRLDNKDREENPSSTLIQSHQGY